MNEKLLETYDLWLTVTFTASKMHLNKKLSNLSLCHRRASTIGSDRFTRLRAGLNIPDYGKLKSCKLCVKYAKAGVKSGLYSAVPENPGDRE